MLPVITIGREYGSAGHSIGELVAEKLGIPFYDTQLLDQVAEESGFTRELVAEQGEYVTRRSKLFGNLSLSGGFYQEDPQDQIFRVQCATIKKLANEGSCVIVGRCADYILKDDSYIRTLNVFIHSDYPYRARRLREVYNEFPQDMLKYLKQRDRNRATYYKYYTDHEWGDYRNYNLDLDSGHLGIELCADIIVAAAKKYDTNPEEILRYI